MSIATARGLGDEAGDLFACYVELCNQVIAEHQHKGWFHQQVRLHRMLWDHAYFHTIVYDDDPGVAIAEFTLHYDTAQQRLEVLPPGDHPVSFRWKASLEFLRDVVIERPEWYLAHPLMLDWHWARHRLGDEIERLDGRSLLTGAAIGAAAVALITTLFPRRRA